MRPNARLLIVGALALAICAFFFLVPPIVQDEAYHLFADGRTIWGIPNFWNVVSNFPFAVVGILGLRNLRGPIDLVLFAPLVSCGIASVLWWSVTGDLRPCILVQFGHLLILIPALWFVRDARYLATSLLFYGLARLAEFYDGAIFSNAAVSGHTAKHLLAATATCFIFLWRRAASGSVYELAEAVG